MNVMKIIKLFVISCENAWLVDGAEKANLMKQNMEFLH